MRSQHNPIVFLDLHAHKQRLGRLTLELYADLAPTLAENFRQFCTGEYLWRGQPAGYKDTCLHKIISDKFVEGGDFLTNGVGSRPKLTILGYEQLIEDQPTAINHSEAGLLSSVSVGGKSGNLFRVTVGPCPELDGKGVIFGKVVEESSAKVVKLLSGVGVHNDFRPRFPVVVKECGEM